MTARLSQLVTGRQDASLLPNLYERIYGTRLDFKTFGFGALRELLLSVPTLVTESAGSRLYVAPLGYRNDERERKRPRDERDDGMRGPRGGEPRDRGPDPRER